MLESMTGYGVGEYVSENMKAVAEIRSVNYRYVEVSMKIPSQLQNFEQSIKERVQKKVTRGKISLTVRLEFDTSTDVPMHIQEDALKQKVHILNKVCEVAGISEPIRLEHLLAFEDLFEPAENDPEMLTKQCRVVEQAIMNSVEKLLEMRRNEGRHLQNDLEQRMKSLHEHCESVRNSEKERLHDAKKRMSERIEHLVDDNQVDTERLEQEIAILADRLDISEELVRMDSHIRYFTESLKTAHSQGKKLNFILQEMHREVNTIGSKANNSDISRMVVEMKEVIENIREQIQNIA